MIWALALPAGLLLLAAAYGLGWHEGQQSGKDERREIQQDLRAALNRINELESPRRSMHH